MALSQEQKDEIIALFKKGDLSNVAIAKKVGCGETAVRRITKEHGAKKSEITELADREITNTIIGNEIKAKKSEFTEAEKRAYDEVYLTMAQSLNLFNNSTIENQELINMAQEGIIESATLSDGTVDKSLLVGQLPNLMAISKTTEANRKQMLGVTETYKAEKESQDRETIVHIIEDKKDNAV